MPRRALLRRRLGPGREKATRAEAAAKRLPAIAEVQVEVRPDVGLADPAPVAAHVHRAAAEPGAHPQARAGGQAAAGDPVVADLARGADAREPPAAAQGV